MSTTRSTTPPRLSVVTNLVKNIGEYLDHGEFPMYNEAGKQNCPPAPPRNTKEIRVCHSCRQTYQIEIKTAPLKKCGFCKNNR